MNERVIAIVRKSNTEEIRVSIAERDGYRLVDLRVFSPTACSRGEPKPTRAGICMLRERLPDLIEALRTADREASR